MPYLYIKKCFFVFFLSVLAIFSYAMESNEDLFKAVQRGDINTVKELLKRGEADVHVRDRLYQTPLFIAAKYDVNMVHCLIKYKANPHAKDLYGRTPIFEATRKGNIEAIRCLIEDYEADVNVLNGDGENPIFTAIRCQRAETIRCLAEHGAYVRVENNRGEIPLEVALRYIKYPGSLAIIKELCNAGSLLLNKRSTVFHEVLNLKECYLTRSKLIKKIITDTHFDFHGGEMYQHGKKIGNKKLLLLFIACNNCSISSDMIYLIFSKLPLEYLQENKILLKRLVYLGYKQNILAQVYDRIARVEEALQTKNDKGEIPLIFFNRINRINRINRKNRGENVDEIRSLLDGSKLQSDLDIFVKTFPERLSSLRGNLVFQMYNGDY